MTECDCNELDRLIFKCMDCAMCTNCNYEYYMVHDSIWHEANPKDIGMLCIGCLESRRGKLLTKDDFTGAPLNSINLITGSARLKNRLTQVGASAIV